MYSALGGISKTQFSKHKALLKLCDEATEMADRHNLEASLLDGLTQLNPEDQVELIQQIVRLGLTQKQIRDIIQKGCVNATNFEDESEPLPKSVIQIARLALKPDERFDPGTLARALVDMERDKGVAKARLKALRDMLEEAELHIDDL